MISGSLEESIMSTLNMDPSTVNLDGVPEWGEASVKGQVGQENSWEMSDVKVYVFDLSKPEDIKKYQALLKRSMKNDPNEVIWQQERKFCENIGNWKVFTTTVSIKYKKLTGNKRS